MTSFLALSICAAPLAILAAPAAGAQTAERQAYELPAQPLANSLRAVSIASRRSIVAPSSIVADLQAPALAGSFTVEEALTALLAGSGLRARAAGQSYVIDRDTGAGDGVTAGGSDIIVTGSRIRGGPVASPVITVARADFADQGKHDLGEVVRSIPQSFGGGQNPGLGINVPSASGIDIGGASSLNLRGLGSDATLTLLDGRRLAFTASRQSIDVSAIPIGAVERLEIVPDGASAIYGSDAVAGVANIILRRKADGVEAGARIGAASDGGDFQQQYFATAGASWSGGSVVGSYDYGRNTAIVGAQRSFAAGKPGLTLYPALHHHSAMLVGSQNLTANLKFEVDALFNIRWSTSTFPTVPSGDIKLGRATNSYRDRSWAIAPALTLDLAGDWRVVLSGAVGQERVNSRQDTCTATACTQSSSGFYANRERAIELGGDGRLFELPGGAAKIAIGAGYRSIDFARYATNGSAVNTSHRQSSYYGYGELELPLVGGASAMPGLYRLTATGAVRYERYPGQGGVATPKVGLVYAPMPDLDVKLSWGKAFRVPTQYQQYQPRAAVIYPPSIVGGSGFPAAAGVLYVQGGNPALKPERATTWSATVALHPRAVPGASLEVSYFRVDYRDRIVSPIAFVSQALSNPLYASQIVRNPSAAFQAQVIASAATLFNITGVAYDQANIVAFIDNASVNAGRQRAQGIDVLARYRTTFPDGQRVGLTVDLSYLDSDQQISSTQPVIPLAGRIFSPPRWRSQSTLSYGVGPLSLAATLNVSGDLLDARTVTPLPIAGMTTVDLTSRFRLSNVPGPLRGVEFSVSVSNLFNTKPPLIVSPGVTDTPYDSTNYSPVGRFVSIGLSRKF
ncbi:TonB-dependent receptor [Sphingomonas sp.]|uniref:TonB-dependent receptor n=1 Tax=Sphingomonas sp. TaxID=28214 RepID=UPI002E31BA49|nr:TonB-dependent receptor [Sphingomonas sp.]HEX4693589.1 TonB-dependent receptor [Sphingomonas sp.]